MAIDFPNSPELYDEYTAPTGRTWFWTGSTWKSKTVNLSEYIADTTNVHGISNTADLAYLSDLDSKQNIVPNITDTEIGYLDNVSSNIQDQLDDKADTLHSHQLLDISDVTASVSEINVLDGMISTTSELNYVAGVTSSIQDQLDDKSNVSHTHVVADISNLFASEVELNYVTGTTSNIQDQIDSKANVAHPHVLADITDVTATFAEVNVLDGITATTAELNYSGGVTSSIQDQIDSKASIADPTFTGTATIPYAQLTPTSTKPTWVEGNLYYDSEEKTVVIQGSGTTFEHNLGQREWVRCRNDSGEILYKGTPVYITGVHIPGHPIHGHHPTVEIADASDINKKDVIGLAGEDIAIDSHGYVVVRGYIEGIDTSSLIEGRRAHLGFETPGTLVSTAPDYPNYPMDVGFCLTSDATDGTFYVNIFDHTVERFRVTADAYIDGNLTIDGNFTLHGSQSEIQLVNLAVSNSFIYLNSGDTIGDAETYFLGAGLNDATLTGQYEGTTAAKTFSVKIDGVGTGTGGVDTFIWSTDDFLTSSSTIDITLDPIALEDGIYIDFVSTNGHTLDDVWYGTASPINIDTGWFSSRNTGTSGIGYTHIGMFYDISDSKYKFIDAYAPEPSGDINTSDPSFTLATIAASTIEGNLIGNVNGTLSNGLNAIDGVSVGSIASGDVLYHDGSSWVNKYVNAIPTKTSAPTITANNYSLVSGDAGLFLEINNSSATTVTIPTSEIFPIGTQIAFMQSGVGAVSIIVQNAGTQTLNYSPGNILRDRWSVATLLKRSTNTWVLYGDLIA